ncbi:hypothetical protein MOBT1_001264 [Malassezia obtusa]|uniref:Exocyst complex component Sec3 PIP2-binding N-terminal domain-containing protein n=1 Tax=Malassezia obtusa TaxID=76774 RepID=A0AAF0ISX1_9BASI|nr:hypothetical protein MOBT1_001264 [Malassezia obtusa]
MSGASFREQFAAALQSRGTPCVYTSHLKVYEYPDDKGPAASHKTRFLLLAQAPDRRSAALYKAKRNANGSFSIGKEWDLATLKELELQPESYVRITLSRSYRWQADKSQNPAEFLTSLARALQALTGRMPVCTGWQPSGETPQAAMSPPRPAPSLVPDSGSYARAPVQSAPAAAAPVPTGSPLPGLAPPAQTTQTPAQRDITPSASPAPALPVPVSPQPAPAAVSTPPVQQSTPQPAVSPQTLAQLAPALSSRQDSAPTPPAAPLEMDRRPSNATPDLFAARDSPAPNAKHTGLARPAMAFAPTASETAAARRAGGKENATLTHVEEMLEGFEWKSGSLSLGVHTPSKKGGTADVIEARLLEELAALESSNIHAMIESDDRVNQVLQNMDDALSYLDQLDGSIAGYKRELNARAEDIAFVESQNRGLQVQTSNQRVLLQEIQTMLASDNVDSDTVRQLSTVNVESTTDVPQIEAAATTLYKSILQTRPDRGMRQVSTELNAMTERLHHYETIADQFSSRLVRGIADVFEREAKATLSDPNELRQTSAPNATLPPHERLEQAVGKYCGLMLYMKETSPALFEQLSGMYLRSAAHVYHVELQRVFSAWRQQLLSDDAMQRSAGKRGGPREKSMLGPNRGSETLPWEALQRIFAALVARIQDEQAFISDLLHINDSNLTFADYMDLEPHYRHRAVITSTTTPTSSGMDMSRALAAVFASLTPELDHFVGSIAVADRFSLVGMLAETERVVRESASRLFGDFLQQSLSRVLSHMHSEFVRLVDEQTRAIEQTKLSVKKRKGIVPFVRAFPQFVQRIEGQLVDADELTVRATANEAYERVGRAMFSMLQSMSNMSVAGVDEDKGQLNHFVILIENMHHVKTRVKPGTPPNPALERLQEQAQAIYAHSLNGYVQTVLRRSLGKMTDFCNGIDALLQTTPANEVTLHSTYSKSSAKKIVREYTAKDLRKAVEALSKRVQKHFTEDDETGSAAAPGSLERDETAEVLAQVWHASEDAFVKETERFLRILKTCYSDSLQVDYTTQDVRRPFYTTPPTVRRK